MAILQMFPVRGMASGRIGFPPADLARNIGNLNARLSPASQLRLAEVLSNTRVITQPAVSLANLTPENLSLKVTQGRLEQAIRIFNQTTDEAIQLSDFVAQGTPTPVFSRVSDFLSGVRTGQNIYEIAARLKPDTNSEAVALSQRIFDSLSVAAQIALRASGQTQQSVVNSFYGRKGSGCPEEVRALFGEPLTPNTTGYGGLLGSASPHYQQLLNRPIEQEPGQRQAHQLTDAEKENMVCNRFHRLLNAPAGNFNNDRLAEYNHSLNLLKQLVLDRNVPLAGGFASLIDGLKIIAQEGSRPLAERNHRALYRATRESLLSFHNLVTVAPRMKLGTELFSGAAVLASLIYGTYRSYTSLVRDYPDLGTVAMMALLLSAEAYYLTMGFMTNSAILHSNWVTKGANGHSWVKPLRKGLELAPEERDPYACLLVLGNEPPESTIWNIYSQTTAARFHSPNSSVMALDNSSLMYPSLGVEAAVSMSRKKWARMELINRMAGHLLDKVSFQGGDLSPQKREEISLRNHLAAYYFSIALGCGSDEMSEPDTAYWAIDRVQEQARRFGVEEMLVKPIGRILTREFEKQITEGSHFNQNLSRENILKELTGLGIKQPIAENIALLIFENLNQLIEDKFLTYAGNQVLQGQKLTDEERERYCRAAERHGIPESVALELLEELRSNCRQIEAITSAVVSETATNDPDKKGEFEWRNHPLGWESHDNLAAVMYRIFINEQEYVGIPKSLRRRLPVLCQSVLLEGQPLSKRAKFKIAKKMSHEIAEAVAAIEPFFWGIHQRILQAPDLSYQQASRWVLNDYREKIGDKIRIVLKKPEYGLKPKQINEMEERIIDQFDRIFRHWQICSEEMFQKVARRIGSLKTAMNSKSTAVEADKEVDKIVEELTAVGRGGMLGSSDPNGNVLISLVLKRMNLTGLNLNEADAAIRTILGECGDFCQDDSRLIHLLQSRLRFSKKAAQDFARMFVEEYKQTILSFKEAVLGVKSAFIEGAITRISPENTTADEKATFLGELPVSLEELQAQVENAVVFKYVDYQGGQKAGSTDLAMVGDTVEQWIAELTRWTVQQMLEERIGLRRSPAEIVTRIDELVNSYRRDLPLTMDSYYRDPRYIASYFIRNISRGVNPVVCVRNFFEMTGMDYDHDVPTQVDEGLIDVAQNIQGRLVFGRMVNALCENPDLNVGDFVKSQFNGQLPETHTQELIHRGEKNLQKFIRSGVIEVVGQAGHRSLKLSAAAARNDEEERVLASFYQNELTDFSSFDRQDKKAHVSPNLVAAMAGIEVVFETDLGRDENGQAIDPIEVREPLANGFNMKDSENKKLTIFAGAVAKLADSGRATTEFITVNGQLLAPVVGVLDDDLKPQAKLPKTPELQNFLERHPDQFDAGVEAVTLVNRFRYDSKKRALILSGLMTEREKEELKACFTDLKDKRKVERLFAQSAALAGAVTLVKRSLFRKNAISRFGEVLKDSLERKILPDYSPLIAHTLNIAPCYLSAAERKACESDSRRLAGIFEEIRTRTLEGTLQTKISHTPQGEIDISISLAGGTVDNKKKVREQLEEALNMLIFDEPPTARQIAEERILRGKIDNHRVIRSKVPGQKDEALEARLALGEEFRRLSDGVDQLLNFLENGGTGAAGGFDLMKKVVELGARAASQFSEVGFDELNLDDLETLDKKGLLNRASRTLTVDVTLSEVGLRRLLEPTTEDLTKDPDLRKIETPVLRERLSSLFELARVNTKKIAAALIPEVIKSMAAMRDDLMNNNSFAGETLYPHNYFNESAPIIPFWKYRAGVGIQDADFRSPKHAFIEPAGQILEHPSLVHFSYRQAGRNAREKGAPRVSASGQNSYFAYYTTIENTLMGIYASAGSPPTYSPEAFQHSARLHTKKVPRPTLEAEIRPKKLWEDFKTTVQNIPLKRGGKVKDSRVLGRILSPFLSIGDTAFGGAADAVYWGVMKNVSGASHLIIPREVDRSILTADKPDPAFNNIMQIFGPFTPLTESEDYGSLWYLRRVPWLGDAGGSWFRKKGLQYFQPHNLFGSAIDEGKMSIGSVQDNLLVKGTTDYMRWSRGNLGIISDVLKTPMGAYRKARYLALAAHWMTGGFRPILEFSPWAFIAMNREAILMGGHPAVFLTLAVGTFALNMGSFLNSMRDRGYFTWTGALKSLGGIRDEDTENNWQTWGCIVNDWAGSFKMLKAVHDGLILRERPPFEISPKEFVAPDVRLPLRQLKTEYTAMNLDFGLAAGSVGFALLTAGNPWMLAAGAWSAYHGLLRWKSLREMNRGAYVEDFNGRGAPVSLNPLNWSLLSKYYPNFRSPGFKPKHDQAFISDLDAGKGVK